MALGKRSRRLLIALLLLIVIGITAWLALPLVIEPIIRSKLEALATAHLHAGLQIGTIDYSFPYTVKLRNVHVISIAGQDELFSATQMELALTQLPIHPGPLQVERIALDEPAVKIIKREPAPAPVSPEPASTAPASREPAATPPASTQPAATEPASQEPAPPQLPPFPEKPPAAAMKLSDLFRIRLISIRSAKVSYEDQRRAGATSVVWENINTDLRLTPQSPSVYGWEFTADSGAVADVASSGTIDIDQLLLNVKELAVNARVGQSEAAAALPGKVQEFLRRFDARGEAALQASASLPLRDLDSSTVKATLRLADARATIKGTVLRGTATIVADRQSGSPQINVMTPPFTANIGDGTLQVARASAIVEPVRRSWKLKEFSAAGEEMSLVVPGFDGRRVEHVKGSMQLDGEKVLLQNLVGMMGEDQITLVSGQVQRSERGFELSAINSTIECNASRAPLSGKIGKVIDALGPSGRFDVRGRFAGAPGQRPQYELIIATRGGGLNVTLGKRRVELNNVRGEALVTQQRVTIRRLLGNTLDGALAATGTVALDASPKRWGGDLSLQQLDVNKVTQKYLSSPDKPAPATSGRLDGSVSLRGEAVSIASLTGNGELRITDGQLWEIPIFKGIVSRMKLAREALTAGEAAAVFEFGDSKFRLNKGALNSPALGLQADGTIGFDGDLDLDVMAAPLGDWDRHLRSTGIPLVSDLAGSFAGAVQRVVNSATSQLLFEFKVSGRAADPQVEGVPAPILTDAGAQLLGKMMRKDEDLLDAIKEKK